MKGHHGAFIQIEGAGHAFIDGIKSRCDHDYSGMAFMLSNGDYLLEKDIMCPTNEATQEYAMKIAEDRDTWICGQTSVCKRCGKVYTMGDAIWDSFENEKV